MKPNSSNQPDNWPTSNPFLKGGGQSPTPGLSTSGNPSNATSQNPAQQISALTNRMGLIAPAGVAQGPQPSQPDMSSNPSGEQQTTPQTGPVENATMPGKNPGGTKFLTAALQAMNNVITASVDPQEITLARVVIKILTNMITADQGKQDQAQQALGQSSQGPQGGPQMPPGLGLPGMGQGTGQSPAGPAMRNMGLISQVDRTQPNPSISGRANATPSTGYVSPYGQ